jgi:hypothetical protein
MISSRRVSPIPTEDFKKNRDLLNRFRQGLERKHALSRYSPVDDSSRASPTEETHVRKRGRRFSFSDSPVDDLPPAFPLQETPVRKRGRPKSTQKKQEVPLDPGIALSPKRRRTLIFDPNASRPPCAKERPFGTLPGLYVGKTWHTRLGAAWDGTHPSAMGGIAVRESGGACSVALSGGYEDDIDEGYRFVYTGAGGHHYIRGQTTDQQWTRTNIALRRNVQTEKPVRVIRGFKGDKYWSPPSGYMYSGLYEVVACWKEKGTRCLVV